MLKFGRRSLAESRGWLVCLAVLALFAGTVPGHQKVSLCLSADGHLDLRLAAQACRACPDTGCATEDAPDDNDASRLPFGSTCCYDIPLTVDLIGWVAPRAVDTGDQEATIVAFAALPTTAPELLNLAGAVDLPPTTSSLPPSHLAALATVVLLL